MGRLNEEVTAWNDVKRGRRGIELLDINAEAIDVEKNSPSPREKKITKKKKGEMAERINTKAQLISWVEKPMTQICWIKWEQIVYRKAENALIKMLIIYLSQINKLAWNIRIEK